MKEEKGQKLGSVQQREKDLSREVTVIGLGASADGIHALETFFTYVHPDPDLSYVVVQHMSANRQSLLSEILQRKTNLKVGEIENKQPIEGNHVYIVPGGHHALIKSNHLFLKKFPNNKKSFNLPIDHFFHVLGDEKKDRAIAVLLTGSGSDGVNGIKSIKSNGGFIIAQVPESANFPSMPQHAIDTGMVDIICRIEEMPEIIQDLTNSLDSVSYLFNKKNESQVAALLLLLKSYNKHDFSRYKRITIVRRINRRIIFNKLSSLEEYIDLVKKKPDELEALFKELLIGVTSFFRNSEAYESLYRNVFPSIFSADPSEPVRIWTAACATGEEAYTLGILAREFMEEKNLKNEVVIFASDIDKKALNKARHGRYPFSIVNDISPNILSKYFTKKENYYQVNKNIRDMVVFAYHSIIKDAPYSQLDLISCRNFLIYLEPESQKHVLNTFHFSLKKNRYLFLGNSETNFLQSGIFEAVDVKFRIYKKIENRKAGMEYIAKSKNYSRSWEYEKNPFRLVPNKISLQEFAEKKAMSESLFPYLVIDRNGEIQYSLGRCEDYFSFNTGVPNQNIVNLAREGLKIPISNALRKININGQSVSYTGIQILTPKGKEFVDLSVSRISQPEEFNAFLILTLQPSQSINDLSDKTQKSGRSAHSINDEYIHQLENELVETREYLKNIIEQLELSNEELKSSNEEVQTSNEELQSTNEELETSREEMQSLNEELETSNNELQRKIDEVSTVNNDLNNFLQSTEIGTLFLDRNLRIKRFTPKIKSIVNLAESDIGRSIKDFGINYIDEHLFIDIERVMENLIPVEKEISKDRDQQYWMRILPYRTSEDVIEGTVLTFTNISEKLRIEKLVRDSEKWRTYQQLFQHMDNGFALFESTTDEKGDITGFQFIESNKAFEESFKIDQGAVKHQGIADIFPLNSYESDFIKLGRKVLKGKSIREDREIPSLNKIFRILYFSNDQDKLAILTQDITSISQEIKSKQHLAAIVESNADAIYSISLDGRVYSWNEGAKNLYGFSQKEILGKSIKEMNIHPKLGRGSISEKKNGSTISKYESQHTLKNGTVIPVYVTESLIQNEKDDVVAVSYIVRDMSIIKERELAIVRAREEADRSANLKSAFLANISHELRTPLNSILGFTNILLRSNLDEKHKHHIRTISNSGIQLLNLMNDIVDISRLDANELPLTYTSFDLHELMEELKEIFQGFAINQNKKHIKLLINLPKDIKKNIIRSDRNRLSQILQNLLSNAFKYTEKGSIEFGYTIAEQKRLQFFVRDTGIGIDQNELESIFERFKQSKQGASSVVSGTGLGLAISRGLCNLLGGKIWAESGTGRGSSFIFTIPFVPGVPLERKHKPKKKDLYSPVLSNKKILLAEDDSYSIVLMSYMLEDTHVKLFVAEDGEKAVEIFYREIPDLVLLDIRLPKLNGYEVLKKIHSTHPKIPVIAQTAYALPEDKKESLNKGFSDYLTKPVTQQKLISILHLHLTDEED